MVCTNCMLYSISMFQSHRNLSQLPNFAFSLPLALFHDAQDDKGFDDGVIVPCSEADHKVLYIILSIGFLIICLECIKLANRALP